MLFRTAGELSQAREILISLEEWEEMNGQAPAKKAASPKPRRSHKILLERPEEDRQGPPPGPESRRFAAELADEYEDEEEEDEDK